MNSQLSTFMALSGLATANSHLTDPRPAWIWAEDGKTILWANPAGAAFFGVRSLRELADLTGLARAPARPHIMRIAASGPDDRDTTDRLRFYRGLRVMLLTCTCRRLVLADGSSAALIVANDAPPAPQEALSALVPLVADADAGTAVLYDTAGTVVAASGALDAPGFDAVSARLRSAKHAPVRAHLAFDDGDHAAMLLMLDSGHTLAVIAADPEAAVESRDPAMSHDGERDQPGTSDTIPDADDMPAAGDVPEADVTADTETVPETLDVVDAETPPEPAPAPQRRRWGMAGGGLFGFASATRFLSGSRTSSADADARIDAERAQTAAAGQASTPDERVMDDTFDGAEAHDMMTGEGEPFEEIEAGEPDNAEPHPDDADVQAEDDENAEDRLAEATADEGLSLDRFAPEDMQDDASADADEQAEAVADAPSMKDDMPALSDFVFEARARPVRFAWKMDIDRRFTFLSTEFEDALGPEAADVVGLTWDEVCERFGVDQDGRVAAALQRRDTWSGRSVDWPVSGAPLRVPVDMAALPAFDRNRTFEGFRGFGVCRTGDAANDPDATGTHLRVRPPLEALGVAAHADSTADAHDLPDVSRPDDPAPDDDPLSAADETASEDAVLEETGPAEDPPETILPVEPAGFDDAAHSEITDTAFVSDDEDDDTPPEPEEEDLGTDAGEDTKAETDGDDPETDPDSDLTVTALAGAAAAAALTAGTSHDSDDAAAEDAALAASRLSKPEREAFRKIAEALGANSESDTAAASIDEESDNDASDRLAALDDTAEDEAGEAALDGGDGEETADESDPDDHTADADAEPADDEGIAYDDTDAEPVPRVPARPYLTLASSKDALTRDEDADDDAGVEDSESAIDTSEVGADTPPPTRAQRTSLLDRLPVGVAIIDGTDVDYANATLLNLLGYPDTQALSAAGGLEALFAEPEEWPATVPGKMSERTMRLQLADGGARPVKARLHTVPWKGGNALMMSLLDRHDPGQEAALDRLHEVQSALALAEARVSEMDGVLETATDGVLILDEDGLIVKVNRSAEALFNATREEMAGVALVDYLAPESRRDATDYLDGLARNGVASVLNDGREVIGQIRSGGLIPLFMTIGRVGQDEKGPHFCTVLRDITQWKTAEEELTDAKRQAENASSQKSDFLAKISHEIRTPLNAIIGFSEVMMEERFGPVGNDRYKGYLRDIHNSGSHIMSLINDLLDLSKIEAGKLELTFEAVSANDIIRECVALMQPQANRERVIIRASLPGSVPNIVADGRSVRQVILNLLSNAIKFNQPGGQVIVSSALEDSGEVILRVRDTGTGMSHKDLEAAMEPFRQLHTARHGGGTGLGLPLTKALVEANRANFRIDSEVNQGTLIEVTFPPQRVLAE
ncbi:ATP-binding protein [Stappia sp. ES.058]|uniref:ATP-binding protein n=1 Tax=Stappia sp. ES.058 TaxID=1881061 RepID=UPI00087C8A89|nr:ATP-binding protein [Stappia sp. ES.058]SDT90193.1 PAS domain S-box-containing protein [Stappia sp. ES.058]